MKLYILFVYILISNLILGQSIEHKIDFLSYEKSDFFNVLKTNNIIDELNTIEAFDTIVYTSVNLQGIKDTLFFSRKTKLDEWEIHLRRGIFEHAIYHVNQIGVYKISIFNSNRLIKEHFIVDSSYSSSLEYDKKNHPCLFIYYDIHTGYIREFEYFGKSKGKGIKQKRNDELIILDYTFQNTFIVGIHNNEVIFTKDEDILRVGKFSMINIYDLMWIDLTPQRLILEKGEFYIDNVKIYGR